MNLSRRDSLGWLCALGLLPLLPACTAKSKIMVAAHVWPGYAFLFLARDEGWLPPEEIGLLETSTATQSIERLRAGEVMAAALTLDEVLLARSQGVPLTVAMVFDVSAGADMVIARPQIRSLADLKGKRIAVETSAVGSLMLSKMLAEAGLTQNDIELVEMSGNHLDAWDRNLADAVITYDPTASQLLKKGGVSLFNSRQMPELIFDVLAVRSDVLKAQAATVRKLVAAHFKGVAALRHTPADTTYRLAKQLGLKGNEVMAAYRGVKMPDISANRAYLSNPSSPLYRAARDLAGLMQLPPKATENLFNADMLPLS